MNKRKFFKAVTTLTIVLSLMMFAVLLVKGQEAGAEVQEPYSSTQPTANGTQTVPDQGNEIKIPELNLLRIQNLNFRFQLLVNQRNQIEEDLREIQVEVFAELENVRKSLNADSDTWNVDLVKGVFVRKPKPEEEKKE